MVLEISGIVFAMLGASLSMGLAAIGSGMGVYFAGSAGAGVLAEDPTKFGQTLVYDVLPQTQGVYGLLGAILIMLGTGIMGGSAPSMDVGMAALFIGLVIGLGGLTAIPQGQTAAAGVAATAKNPGAFAGGIIFTVMVETFAIFSLLVGILAMLGFGII
jgi:V/A-type H+-transporting ATPase subunit K